MAKNWTQDEYQAYLTAQALRQRKERDNLELDSQREGTKPKFSPSDVALVKNEDKEADSKRIKIIYRVFRKRFLDPENCFLKWHTDALRYEGLIKDDRYEDVEIRVQQFKSKEEYVEIEIIYPCL